MHCSAPSRWIVALIFGAFGVVGCTGTTDTGSQGETGSLSVDLVLADGIEIDEVGWQITGNDMDMSGDIDVSAPGSTASVEVFGLPPGEEDYTVTLTATSVDEAVTCQGSADFNVEIGEATEVMVMLNCKKPRTLGGVRVNGKFNICTQLEKVVVSPLQTSVGNDISLSSIAFDEEGDAITYVWSGDGGSIADPTAANTTYTCQEVGEHSVTILVTDNDVYCRMATWTVPVTCVEGDGGDLCEDEDCDDGNECTDNDCDPANGECINEPTGEGDDCDLLGLADGMCMNGECVEKNLCEGIDCDDDNECTDDGCDPEDGSCDYTDVDNGTECQGGDGTCVDGDCVVIVDKCEIVICDDTGNDCTEAKCNAETGICDVMNIPDATECNDGAGACSDGECIDNNMCEGVNCPSDNDCVQDGMCDPADGMCIPGDNEPEDTDCDLIGLGDGFCDDGGSCVECNNLIQCPNPGVCNIATCADNSCGSEPLMDGLGCDFDGIGDGVCEAGKCVAAPECVSPGDCADGNVCTNQDCVLGACVYTENDGASCDVGGLPGLCKAGDCIGLCDDQDCTSTSECVMDGTCDDQTGDCVVGDNEPADTICTENDGKVCDGDGTCVECNSDNQCDVEFNEVCVDNSCITVAQACGAQTKTVTVGCTNGVTTAQSPFPFSLSVDVPTAIAANTAFSADLDGVGLFPEFFLDAAQGVVCGGVRVAQLVEFISTVQVRSGATGADVPLGIDESSLTPGPVRFCNFPFDATCTVDGDCLGGTCEAPVLLQELPVLDGIPNSAGGCDFDDSACPAPGSPTDCDCSPCAALDSGGSTTKLDQCTTNGFCQNGDLVVEFAAEVGNYLAGAAGGTVLLGWSDQNVPGLLLCPDPGGCGDSFHVDGCYDLPPSSFALPTAPIGIRVDASGLAVAIQCAMASDGGSCSTAATQGCLTDADCPGAETCVGIGADDDIVCPTPDADLIACPVN